MAKQKKKWNRAHEFQWHKSTKTTKGHPAYVYQKRGRKNKYLVFTHSSTTNGKENEKLNYNIDPDEKERDSYVRKMFFVDDNSNFEKSKRKYRIHAEDRQIINKYKK
jgi:hypothetical protein